MRATRQIVPVTLALLTTTLGAQQPRKPSPAPPAASPPPVEVRTAVSRTALWVGDRVSYVVELRTSPDVEILLDDLAPEQLKLNGLEVLDTAAERDTSVPDEVTHRMRYTLASFATEQPDLSIAPAPVRYSVRRAAQRPGEAMAAGEVVVPELKLGLRSTIPANDPSLGLRDERELKPLPLRARIARPLGLTLILLAFAPVALWVADLGRRVYRARVRRRSTVTVKQRRAALEELKLLDVNSPEARRNAYLQLDTLVRDHVHAASGLPAAALTSNEFAGCARTGRRKLPVEQIERIIAECERAKYAPVPPPADRWRTLLDQADEVITA